ncbi:C2H2-type zinc finger protein [Natronomonas sp.]|uniref:C2H2-type zinc finger protein n=1 Tax=Natronomonas sp. TaxID=2184060 RepID=UPI002FC3557D
MECPRCAEELERYALQGREAFVCTACGYIGVPVEHRGEYEPPESWDDAISRFHNVDRVESVTIETTEADPTPEFIDEEGEALDPAFIRIDAGNGTEAGASTAEFACTVCGETFDSEAALDGHRAVHTDDEKEA